MAIQKYDAPGLLSDFNEQQVAAWSSWISNQMDEAIRGNPEELEFDAPRSQFFNLLNVELDTDAVSKDIEWTAFPRNIAVSSISDRQRWRTAESSRDFQDEYCEWSVERDPDTDKITKVTFTSEGPEYWDFLAKSTPSTALALYREHVSELVRMEDLFDSFGNYNPRNRWNNSSTNGVMHLIQRNNSLSAEIELAGGSSIVREKNGRLLTAERELIECGKYGGIERHSDPRIGSEVNSLTRQKANVTLANPVGLYFSRLITDGWEVPGNEDPLQFWNYVRGSEEYPVRAVFHVPSNRDFVVGDIKIDGRNIEYGSQIADKIKIKLTGIAHKFGQSPVQPMRGCRREIHSNASASDSPSLNSLTVEESLSQSLGRRPRR